MASPVLSYEREPSPLRLARDFPAPTDSDESVHSDPAPLPTTPLLGETPDRARCPSARTISNATLGLTDGLTVPFALTAGLSGLGSLRVVVLGGLAELIAGAISMGLGGWISSRGEAQAEGLAVRQLRAFATEHRTAAVDQIVAILEAHGLRPDARTRTQLSFMPPHHAANLIRHLEHAHADLATVHADPTPSNREPARACVTIGCAYAVGGFVPLLPYLVQWLVIFGGGAGDYADADLGVAFACSCGVMLLVLAVFGFVKAGVETGFRGAENRRKGMTGAAEMVGTGTVAAGASWAVIRLMQILL